jgi:stage III sporulation protein AB
MTMIKLLGSCLIMLVSSYIGFAMALRCSRRPQEINQLIQCLVSLKSYIGYAVLPLDQALVQCTQGVKGQGAMIFKHMGASLKADARITPQEALDFVLGNMRSLSLEDAERDLLRYFAANLGTMNCKEQEKMLDVVRVQFEKLEQEAMRLKNLNTKLYRYLGICGGLAVVILLF